jgi:hypothetical protein
MLTHIRRRKVLAAALAGAAFAALGVTVASSHAIPAKGNASPAATSGNPELPVSNVNTSAGKFTPLKAGVSYQASSFPLALRVTPPDGTWAGAQWKMSSHGQPAFGWIAVGRTPLDNPRGVIEIETAFGPTPSVAGILARLRSAGSGANYGKTTRVTVAGFPGWQIDGNVFSRFGHVFVPFSPRTGGASPPDSYRLDKGETYRVVVLDVRGKRVVVFMDSFKLSPEEFAAFLPEAHRILNSLKFPG